ncbi:MAG: V-type ATP synthase subunit E [Clostridia bacterium]|nr:V-type ATP synthase subunit E [Clostridia bacterium]
MTGLDRITERILADAKEKARVILEEAQNDCRKAANDYAERAESIRDEIAERAMREGEDMIARARSSAAMTRRNILHAAKADILDETFAAAKAEICDTDYGKYRELLVALLSCALLEQAKNEQESIRFGDEVAAFDTFEVLLNETDRARFGQSIIEGARRVTERRIGTERVEKLRLSDTCADIEGGLILRYGDVETNCSITVLLNEMRRELEGRISAILFD